MNWLHNLWNSLERLQTVYNYLRFAPVILGAFSTLLGTILVNRIADRINTLKDEQKEARIEALDPRRQRIFSLEAKLDLAVQPNQQIGRNQPKQGFSLTFLRAGRHLLDGASQQSVISFGPGTVGYTSDFSKPFNPAHTPLVSELLETESIRLAFYGMPDNSKVIMGYLNCYINRVLHFTFLIGEQTANGKEIDILDIQTPLQTLKP